MGGVEVAAVDADLVEANDMKKAKLGRDSGGAVDEVLDVGGRKNRLIILHLRWCRRDE